MFRVGSGIQEVSSHGGIFAEYNLTKVKKGARSLITVSSRTIELGELVIKNLSRLGSRRPRQLFELSTKT